MYRSLILRSHVPYRALAATCKTGSMHEISELELSKGRLGTPPCSCLLGHVGRAFFRIIFEREFLFAMNLVGPGRVVPFLQEKSYRRDVQIASNFVNTSRLFLQMLKSGDLHNIDAAVCRMTTPGRIRKKSSKKYYNAVLKFYRTTLRISRKFVKYTGTVHLSISGNGFCEIWRCPLALTFWTPQVPWFQRNFGRLGIACIDANVAGFFNTCS